MAQPEQQETRTYRGNCHCGAFVYEVDLPEIKKGIDCNCSFCTKKGYFMAIGAVNGNFRVVKGSEDALVSYTFGAKQKTHKFCPICATPVLSRMPDGPEHLKLVLNIRAIQDLPSHSLERVNYNGAAVGDAYDPPTHKGEAPTVVVENGKLYTGSCHCGALTIALTSEPLDASYKDKVVECDCSICERNAYMWLFPPKENVVLAGNEEDIGRYNLRSVSKVFCKTCGVNITSLDNSSNEEERAGLSERFRIVDEKFLQLRQVNARTLHGVNLNDLKAGLFNGETLMPSTYENP